jgi:hypothetical protein
LAYVETGRRVQIEKETGRDFKYTLQTKEKKKRKIQARALVELEALATL